MVEIPWATRTNNGSSTVDFVLWDYFGIAIQMENIQRNSDL